MRLIFTNMKITYDKIADALGVTLREGTVARTLEVAPEILVDLDKNDRPLFLEILDASRKVGKKNFGKIFVGNKSLPLAASV